MGPATTLHMLLGAIVGWGVLSPLAKSKGWAPGPVSNWEHGSKGWIVWVSLAIMLADSLISLAWLAGQPLVGYGRRWGLVGVGRRSWRGLFRLEGSTEGYRALASDGQAPELDEMGFSSGEGDMTEEDAPPEHLVGKRTVVIGLIAAVLFCIGTIRLVFGELVPMYATVTAVILALLLSIMGVRALGETDLNPVSGISKLTQLFFSLIIPQSNRNSVLINLIAGAVSEAGAQQAGDLMQDLKTGHLLGASPKAQFHGQLIGSFVGAIASAAVYKLYTTVYPIPGDLFQVPTAYVWIFTARLVTGKGLPPMAREWASGAAVLFAIGTSARIVGKGKRWHCLIPGGIAVAVGKFVNVFVPFCAFAGVETDGLSCRDVQCSVIHPC
jgi:OPT family oligopeptide transporter